jgi:hypothetical protein
MHKHARILLEERIVLIVPDDTKERGIQTSLVRNALIRFVAAK